MKGNKGFTLVEILIAITLIGLVAIVISTNMIGLSNKQKDKDYEKIVTEIIGASKTYVGLNKNDSKNRLKSSPYTINITLAELISEGLLTENLKDPRTENNDLISVNKIVEVKYSASTGKFTYTYDSRDFD